MRESTPATTRARALERVREITLQVLGDLDVRVYLFGSSVTGRLRQSSDIDVAIDPVRALPSALLAELRERLEESAIPYDVDIVDLSAASPEIRSRVEREGSPVERLTGRLAEARRALASFEELARRRERSMIERDAAIMRFACTFEAAWKAVQLYLYEHEGLDGGLPKQSIRVSRAIGLLTDDQAESALSMTDDRNLVVHVYREAVASDLDRRLHLHAVTLAAWLGAIAA
jgi:predicted nucleotidyltransferase